MVVADCHPSNNHRMLWSDQGLRAGASASYNSMLAAPRIFHHYWKAILLRPQSAPVVQTALRTRQRSLRLESQHHNYPTISKRIACPQQCISSNISNNSSATIHFSCQDSPRTQRRQPHNTSEIAPWISQLIALVAGNSPMNTLIYKVRQKQTT